MLADRRRIARGSGRDVRGIGRRADQLEAAATRNGKRGIEAADRRVIGDRELLRVERIRDARIGERRRERREEREIGPRTGDDPRVVDRRPCGAAGCDDEAGPGGCIADHIGGEPRRRISRIVDTKGWTGDERGDHERHPGAEHHEHAALGHQLADRARHDRAAHGEQREQRLGGVIDGDGVRGGDRDDE